MRKVLTVLAVGLLVVVAGLLAVRRVPPGHAAWQAATGELRVAGASGLFVPRWGWQPAVGGALRAELSASSREGARVGVGVVATLPPGRYTLAPADQPAAGLGAACEGLLREQLAAIRLECLAGLGGAGCPAAPERELAASVVARLRLGPDAVAVTLAPDPEALAAARRAVLKARVGTPPRRVLLVGWDGADWEVIGPLARRGAMPALARLMAHGTWGELESITPLLSPLIWTTMATGVGPEEHGVLDFVEVDPTSGARVAVTGRQRKVPALWNMATAAGLTVDVSGWWATWPAETVNGRLVSDRLIFPLADAPAPAEPGTVVFPPSAEGELRALAERAEAETDAAAVRALLPVSADAYQKAMEQGRGMADPIDGFRRVLVGTRTYFAAALLGAAAHPALTMTYCIGTDAVGHVLAPHLPPALSGADAAFSPEAKIGVERYFTIVDRWLDRLVATCPESECAILVVSDHGFKWGDDRPREFSGVAAATAALWHRPHGVFVLAGNGVRSLGRVDTVPSVFDVAPTVAALLGLPPGSGWRGKPLPGAPAPRPETVDWALLAPPSSYRPAVGGAAPSPEYVAQLKALGYLESSEGSQTGTRSTEGELNNLGLVHLEARRFAEAEKAFRDSIATNPAYASPHYNLRRLFNATGRDEEADAELWRAVDLGLRDAAGSVARAATDYEDAGKPERAAALLGEATRRFPGDARLLTHRLAVLVRLNHCAEALDSERTHAAAHAGDAAVQAFFGLAAACAGDAATARAAFERSLRARPDQPEIRAALEALPPS